MQHGKELIANVYSKEEFANIREWAVEEKVDGMNIRIIWEWLPGMDPQIRFGGRTKDAQLPCFLLDYLQKTFTAEKMQERFDLTDIEGPVVLYGEGYGPKIQSGGNYRSSVGFIIFDVRCGPWWLERESVADVANHFGVPMVPYIGKMDQQQIIDYVKSKPMSLCSETPQIMEGVVCRTNPLTLYRDGTPILMKLKVKDFYAPSQKKERISLENNPIVRESRTCFINT